MGRTTHIAAVVFLIGSIQAASAQDQRQELIGAADAATSDRDYTASTQSLESALILAQDQQDSIEIIRLRGQLATIHTTQSNYPAAETELSKAITAIDDSNATEPAVLPDFLVERARVRIQTEDFNGAIADFDRAITIREQLLGPQHITVADTLDELADLHLGRSDLRTARQLFSRAAEIRQRTLGENHPQVALGHDNLASVHMARGDTTAAKNNLQLALGIRRAAWNNRHPAIADTLDRLAAVSLAEDDPTAAIEFVEEALAIRVDLFGPDNEEVANTEQQLAALRQQIDETLQPTLGPGSPTKDDSPVPVGVAQQENDNITPEQPVAVDQIDQPPTQVAATPADDPAIAATSPKQDDVGYTIQLSSLRSQDAARQEWNRLRTAYPEILGARDLILTSVDLEGRGTFYRVRTGPFASSEEAQQACADLGQHQQACLAVAP